MSWHDDNEPELEADGTICSLSFGSPRRFSFRHKITREYRHCLLEHGSLLIMNGPTQQYWHHQLPKTKHSVGPRINLTFRRMATPITFP